jgi:hypothetical protein
MNHLIGIALLTMQDDTLPSTFGAGTLLIFWIALLVTVVALWRVYAKAGEPGWAAIVPFYNGYVLVRIAGKPVVWFVLLFIPFVNIVAAAVIGIEVARRFQRGVGFGIGLLLLPVVFYPILAFGDAVYTPVAAA